MPVPGPQGGAYAGGLHLAPYNKADAITDLYEIGDFIAKGGFSMVYRAVHKKTGGTRAIKIMEKSILTNKRATMATRENEILRRCNHRNILQLYEVVETPTQMCLVMEYIAGGDLYDYIVNKRTLREDEAGKIVKSILQAVEYLHCATPPVVHRDIKPENVLIEDVASENVKLSDFGLSKLLTDPRTVECTPGGTSFYLPPEIIDGIKKHGSKPRPTNVADMKALDVWSTGIVLYILLCGSPPFKGSIQGHAERQKLLDQINSGVSFPEHKWKDVSPEAKDLVQGMLKVDPRERLTVSQALRHKWLEQLQHSQHSPRELPTPTVVRNDYTGKEDFNAQVDGPCRGAQAKPVEAVVTQTNDEAAQNFALKSTGPSDFLKNRQSKQKP